MLKKTYPIFLFLLLFASILFTSGWQSSDEISFITMEMKTFDGMKEKTFPLNNGENQLQINGEISLSSGQINVTLQSADGAKTFYETIVLSQNNNKISIDIPNLEGTRQIKLVLLGNDAKDVKLNLASKQKLTLDPEKPLKPGQYDPLTASYYEIQQSPAFKLIQSGRFSRLISHWTTAGISGDFSDPAWNYHTFTQYQMLDYSLKPITDDDLYYCTFSDSNGKNGYFVLYYEEDALYGGGMGQKDGAETAGLYDLQASIDDILEKLNKTDIDIMSATASRGRLVDPAGNHSEEIILFTDAPGNTYIYYLDSFTIEKFEYSD